MLSRERKTATIGGKGKIDAATVVPTGVEDLNGWVKPTDSTRSDSIVDV